MYIMYIGCIGLILDDFRVWFSFELSTIKLYIAMDCSYESPRNIRPSALNDFGALEPINDLQKAQTVFTKHVSCVCEICDLFGF